MPLAKKQQNAERLTSGRVRVGIIQWRSQWHINNLASNKSGRPLTKKNRTPPVVGYFCTQKTISQKRSPQIFSYINKAIACSCHALTRSRAQIIPLKNCSRSLLLHSFLRAYLLRASTTSPPPCSSQLLDIFVSDFLNFGGSLSLCHFSYLIKKSKPLKN